MADFEFYNEDSYPFLKSLKTGSIPLAIIDPPYGINMDKGFGVESHPAIAGTFDNTTPSKEHFDEILRVCEKVLIFGGNFFTDKLPRSSRWYVWDKLGGMKGGNDIFSDAELIWSNLPGNTVKRYTVKQRGFARQETDRELFHPNQKPVLLLEQLLLDHAKPGDTVLDCFAGSFSLGVACKKLGYGFIGIEKDPNYFLRGVDRVNSINNMEMQFPVIIP